MAASGSTPISLYYSSTPTQAPSAGNLAYGEVALNIYDGKMYYKDPSNVVQLLASKNNVAVYPGAGIAVSTGSAWTTSKTSPTGDIVGTTDSQTLTNKILTSPTINGSTVTNYTESVVTIGTVSSAHTFDLTNGTVQTATLTASTACTFTMPTAVAGKSFICLLKQAASTGNGSATFTGVKWNSSGTPTISVIAGKLDILTFVSDGTNWYGSYSQGYTP